MNAFSAIVVNLFLVIGYVFVCIMMISYNGGSRRAVAPWVRTAVRTAGVVMLILGFLWLSW